MPEHTICHIYFTGSEYKVDYSTDNINWINVYQNTSSVVCRSSNIIVIGTAASESYRSEYFRGSVDLSETYIKINGAYLWDPRGISITEDTLTGYAKENIASGSTGLVNVGAVIEPTGSITITTNGTHDVADYAEAVINVSTGGSTIPEAKIVCVPIQASMTNSWSLDTDSKTINPIYVDVRIYESDTSVLDGGAFGDGKLVLPYDDGGTIIVSTDGKTFDYKHVYYEDDEEQLNSIAYKDGIWCASGDGGHIFYTEDIYHLWYTSDIPQQPYIPQIKTCGDYFIAYWSNQGFAKSRDGNNWIVEQSPVTIDAVAYFNDYLYILYTGGSIYRTTLQDSQSSWTQVLNNIGLVDIVANGTSELIAFIGNSTDIIRSTDGINWTTLSNVLPSGATTDSRETACSVDGIIYKCTESRTVVYGSGTTWLETSLTNDRGQLVYCNWNNNISSSS
jgi:hypothetical protein